MNNNASSSNFNQAAWLAISSFSSFALTFVSAAILSRYFDKAEYGTYKQILYVFGTLQIVFTAGLPGVFSYFLPRLTLAQGKTLVNSVNRMFILLGLIFSVFLYFSSDLLAVLLKNPELAVGIKIFSPFPLFTIPTLGVEGIYTALRKTKYIAIYQITNKISMLLCIVLPVTLFHGTYRSAIIGWGVASFLTFLVAMYMKNRPFVQIKQDLIPKMYKSIFDYSLPLMGASMVGLGLNSANQFFISRYYGQIVFAEFSNGYTPIPFIGMIAGSVRGVLLPLFSKAHAEGTMNETLATYKRAVVKSVTLVYPLIFFCMFFAKDIVMFIYGEQYEVSKSYLQASLIKDIAEVIPFLSVLLALGKSKVYFYIHFVFAILIWIVDFLIVNAGLPPIAIALSSSLIQIAIAASCFIYIYTKFKIALIPFSLIKHIITISLHLSLVLTFLFFFEKRFMASWSHLVSLIVIGIAYYTIIILTGKALKLDYVTELTKRLKINRKLW